jgi:hypothetical protein
MKVLKKIESGLIIYEDFSGELHPDLQINAILQQGDSYVEFSNGDIGYSLKDHKNLVLETTNSFIPTMDGGMGGIQIKGGSETRELYEYYETQNYLGTIEYVKVIKKDNKFYGYGANEDKVWIDRGFVLMPYAESIHVSAVGGVAYHLSDLKIYKDTEIVIHSVLPNWILEVYKEGQLTQTRFSKDDKFHLSLPEFPFTCTVKIYDENRVLMCESILEDAWGGDEYSCSANVSIYNSQDIPIEEAEAKDLGKVVNGRILERFRVKNNNINPIQIKISIAEYSPFGDWVHLSLEEHGEYNKEITLDLGTEDTYFWLLVERPSVINTDFNYSQNKCIFYLEVF